jgi:hypothetical protein
MASYPRSIFEPLIEDGERIRDMLLAQIDAVQSAIERVRRLRAATKELRDDLEMAETEHAAEAIALAESGDGPLAGIAKTSKAYQIALGNMLNKARQYELSTQARIAYRSQTDLINAEIVYEQEMAKFTALKHVADLQAAMINGTRV